MGCMTSYESIAINSVAIAAAGSSLWQRLTMRQPRDVVARQRWDEDAGMMRRLGLDPVAVLGPRPQVVRPEPVVEPVTVVEPTVRPEPVEVAVDHRERELVGA